MKTSVIITVYNRPEMLIACLRALALQTVRIEEVVVSDDGSSADAVRRMQAVFGEMPFAVRYVWQADEGYRLAAARNNAIRLACGDYLVSLDSDILLLPDALAAHLRRARRGVFLAANRALASEAQTGVLLQQGLSERVLHMFWEKADRAHLARVHHQFMRNLWLRKIGLARRHKPKILGCHFSLFREDIERINGFDECYVGWGFEDDDLTLRLYRAGLTGRSLIHEARAVHLWHPVAASRPEHPAESPNGKYFSRRHIPARCQRGLQPEPGAGCSPP